MTSIASDQTYNEIRIDVVQGGKSDYLDERMVLISQKILKLSENEITLEDFALAQADKVLFEILLDRFNVRRSIAAINRSFPFFKRLNQTELGVLAKIPLSELSLTGTVHLTVENTPIWFGLIDREDLCNTLIRQIGHSKLSWQVIAKRFECIEKNNSQFFSETYCGYIEDSIFCKKLNFPVGRIRNITGTELNSFFSKLPKRVGHIISSKQLAEMNFVKLTGLQIEILLEGNGEKSALYQRWNELKSTQKRLVFQKVSVEFISRLPFTFKTL